MTHPLLFRRARALLVTVALAALVAPIGPVAAVDPTLTQVDVEDLGAAGIAQPYGVAQSKDFVFAVGFSGQVASYARGRHGRTKLADTLDLPSGNVNTLAVAPDARTVYVTAHDHVFAVGVGTDGDLRNVQDVSTSGSDDLTEPYGVVVSADGRFVYVADNATSVLSVFERARKSGRLTFASAFDQLQNPFLVALSTDDRQVYVTQNAGPDNGLVVLSRIPSSGAVSGPTELPFGNAQNFSAFGIGAGRRTVVLSNVLEPVVESYTRKPSGALTPADVVEPPDLDQLGFLARPGGGSAFYLESRGTHEITRWSVARNGDLAQVATTTSPDILTPQGLCADRDNVYVSDFSRDTLVAFERVD